MKNTPNPSPVSDKIRIPNLKITKQHGRSVQWQPSDRYLLLLMVSPLSVYLSEYLFFYLCSIIFRIQRPKGTQETGSLACWQAQLVISICHYVSEIIMSSNPVMHMHLFCFLCSSSPVFIPSYVSVPNFHKI